MGVEHPSFGNDPTPDDILAWLRGQDCDVYVEALFVSEGDVAEGQTEPFPVVVELVPDDGDVARHSAPTLHAALEAALRAVAEADS